MTNIDEPVTGKSTESAVRPLLWNHPRLRFIEGAPDGAAPDESDAANQAPEDNDLDAPDGEPDATKENPFKLKWENQRKVNRDLEAKLKKLSGEAASKDKPAEEQALDAARREAAAEATQKAHERLIRAEVKAAAIGKVKNPALALKLIDTSAIEVGDDGEVDSDALASAIEDLLTEYPELAADASKFGGGADQGAKGKASKPSQLTKAELSKLSPAEVLKAREDGRLDTLMGK